MTDEIERQDAEGLNPSVDEENSDAKIDSWAERLKKSLSKAATSRVEAVEDSIEVAKDMAAAKADLGDVSFDKLASKLGMSKAKCVFLAQIGKHPVLTNPDYYEYFPLGYNAQYQLSKIPEFTLVQHIQDGKVKSDITTQEATELAKGGAESTAEGGAGSNTGGYSHAGPQIPMIASIPDPNNRLKFLEELDKLTKKYQGQVSDIKKDGPIEAWQRKTFLERVEREIGSTAGQLSVVNLGQLRKLEEAARFFSLPENVGIEALPEDYADYEELTTLLSASLITENTIKEWCAKNGVPNLLTDPKLVNKTVYVWEQARLVTERTDVKGGIKRLKTMAKMGKDSAIKALAKEVRESLAVFEKAAA